MPTMPDVPPSNRNGHLFNKATDDGSDPRAELQEQLAREISDEFAAWMLLNVAIAEKVGIGATDMHALRIAWELGGCSIGTIGDMLHLTSGAVTKMVDRLEAGGFAERLPDPSDRRRTIVRALPGRVDAIGAAFDPLGVKMMNYVDGLTAEQLAAIRGWIAFSTSAALEEAASVRRENPHGE